MENLTENNWSTPQRQSPAAIFIMLMQSAVEIIKFMWPVIVLTIFRDDKAEKAAKGLFSIAGFLAVTLGYTLIKYWFYKFYIDKYNLIIQTGWLKKKTLTIPLQSIQGVHLEQNLWQRVLQVAQVSFDSSGSEKVEAKIDALSWKKAEQLKELLQANPYIVAEAAEEKIVSKTQTRLSTADLMKLSLTSNHLEAFFIIIGLSIGLLDDIKDAFQIDGWGIMESYALQMAGQTALVVSILVVAVALLSIFVSVIRTVIKFYNFTIEHTPRGWKLSFGLINHQQRILPFSKIQILRWRANWLRRKLDFWIFSVQSIGHKVEKHKQHLQIPVTSLNGVLALTNAYQQTPVFTTSEGRSIQPGYWKRKTLIVGLPVSAILFTPLYLWIGLPGISTGLLLIYFGWYFRSWYKTFRWQINDEGLQVYSGVWGRQFTLLTWKKVQQVQLNQSSYQRKHELASIIFMTAGGSVKLPYIRFAEAKYLANLSLYYVESRDENWM